MRARAAYRLIHTREHRGPAFLARDEVVERVEVVEIDSGEVALYWDLPARKAARLTRALREDLGLLEADDFVTAWRATQQ